MRLTENVQKRVSSFFRIYDLVPTVVALSSEDGTAQNMVSSLLTAAFFFFFFF